MLTRERAILNFIDELAPYQMHGFQLMLHGETLSEGYYSPFQPDVPHRMFSVSKSVVSLAIGLLADDGVISLDDHICDHFPEYVDEHTPALLREVTIRNMLCMATCYDRSMYSALGFVDWTKPFFYGEPTHVPGTLFSYDTSASQVMCALVERKTGRCILDFMQERLFDPIGMTGPKKWLKDGVGTSQGGTGLLLTLHDYAKLADFCMSDGRGLLSTEYLRSATSWQIATDERSGPEERYGYGYQFWMMREGFSMYGLGGQMALCLPEKQLALVTTADLITDSTGVQPIYDAFFRHLANIDELPANASDAAELTVRLQTLRVTPISGHTAAPIQIDLTQHTLPFSALTIDQEQVSLVIGGQTFTLPCVPGEWREGVFPCSDERCIISGGWQDADRFNMLVELCGDFAACMKLFVQRSGDRSSVRVVSSLWEFQAGWSGQDWGRIQ